MGYREIIYDASISGAYYHAEMACFMNSRNKQEFIYTRISVEFISTRKFGFNVN